MIAINQRARPQLYYLFFRAEQISRIWISHILLALLQEHYWFYNAFGISQAITRNSIFSSA